MKSTYTIKGSLLEYSVSILHELISKQTAKNPNNLALVFGNIKFNYRELDDLSNQFANYLKNECNVNTTDLVGITLERSEWVIITILAILKTGAAYVPMDPEYPQSRKEYIQKDSNCVVTIDATIISHFNSKKEKFSEEFSFKCKTTPNDPAYVIYTSGTTGNPKGVVVSHKSVTNLITSQTLEFKIDENERILQFSNYCFDASVEQIFLALINGASLFIVDKKVLKDHKLPQFITENKITHLHATPSYLETLIDISKVKSLKRIIAGGESCTLKLAQKLSKSCDFYNEYGPTETTVTSTIYKYNNNSSQEKTLPIGKPIGNTNLYILSESLKLCKNGEVGELCIAGDGLALEYLNKPELTAKAFIDDPFVLNEKIYRTGDLVKLNNNNLEFIGRKDNQVKIRGYRIELGEIEAALNSLAFIKRAVVITNDSSNRGKTLVAYIQYLDENYDSSSCKKQLKELLPDYMIPTIFQTIDKFPTNSNGKIDNNKLPEIKNVRPLTAPILKKPRNKIEKGIAQIWSHELGGIEIGIDDNFFEMGGTSLLTQKVSVLINKKLNINVPVTKIYQYPTISGLSAFLNQNNEKHIKTSKRKKKSTGDIAVIAMACRFPGASTIEQLWNVLKDGQETISFFTKEELDSSIPEELKSDPLYVGARGIVPSAKDFDAQFFGINQKLAEAMDPQQRLFLEIAWEALEQSGHLPKHYDGSIGVYAGTGNNTYFINNVLPNTELINAVGRFQANSVNDKDYIASRTAYHLNLKGPAVSVHSACSTSLLAIAQAVEALRSGQCEVALAGGTSITAPINSGHLYQEGSMLSSDGHCRSFDAEGKGTIFSDGAGIVLLKPLEDAIKDHDNIHGVIKGIGINNDGGNKGSFTAPSVEGQAGAINSAIQDANINPSDISYIEAHGTATPLGDPIEIEGLCLAFGKQAKNQYCAIGSIKSNIGHLTAAAGVAGVIKTILSLKYKQIPASLGFENPNPSIDFKNSPFFVNNTLKNWNCDGKRYAGISSFGVGGTNVHLITEEFETKPIVSKPNKPLQILTWSAKTKNSLDNYKTSLGEYIKSSPKVKLADIAYSLSSTRESFSNRSFTLIGNSGTSLLPDNFTKEKTSELKVVPNDLLFLFPGQGAQYLQMGKALYNNEEVFTEAVNNCSKILLDEFNFDIRTIIYPENNSAKAEAILKDTQYTQPALFVIEYALAKLWMSWGITPTALCGHSIGEFVAGHLSGVFTLKDALILVATRGKLVSKLPEGSMLSVRYTVDKLSVILPKELSIAAINSDQLCVVAGENEVINEFSNTLTKKEIHNKLLLTSHAFHSNMMDPALKDFEIEVKKTTLNVPRIPIISTVTGKWISDTEATNPLYWVNHLRETVRFSDAMETALAIEDLLLLEVGPGRALTTLSKQKKNAKSVSSISSLVKPSENENSYHTILNALGQLWLNGIGPNWNAFYQNQNRERLLLPSYAFDRKRCWVDPPSNNIISNNTIQTTNQNQMNTISQPDRKTQILDKISEIVMNTSGMEIAPSEKEYSFLELGLDSLVLTQMAITCKKEFNTPITFRQLNGEYSTPALLANFLDQELAPELFAPIVAQTNAPQPTSNVPVQTAPQTTYTTTNTNSAVDLIAQQLQLLGKQLELLQGNTSVPKQTLTPVKNEVKPVINTTNESLTDKEKIVHKKPFGAAPKIEKTATEINTKQKNFLDELTVDYNNKTSGSKAYAQKHRSHMSDPRVVTGFKPFTKELVYPLVVEKSSGNKLWDIDGNEYLDTLNGFGSCLLGHQPDFIKEAIYKQVEAGFEVGPQHPLAGEVCELLCELTRHERAALCNTGSEAVLGAMRIARTVTGKSLIVVFTSSYHGINDEVIVRGSRIKKTFPAAPGIMPEAVQNMLVLDYGTEDSLQIIKNRADELAAVLIEPIQSRRPEFQPVEFLKEVREVTKNSNITLIFDEIITGFRMHPQGIQGMYGIKADIATYGKVIGGGISIGAILGSKKYMDALDGGYWQYGDDSFPEVGVTYFAGTFVRHPLALATTKASLLHLKEHGPQLQDNLAKMTDRLASDLNAYFENHNLPIQINHFRSLWRLSFKKEVPYGELIFVLMRYKGIHIWDGFPCYLTTAYKEDDVSRIVSSFIESIEQLSTVGIFNSDCKKENTLKTKPTSEELNTPPVPGAKLGLDENGDPAWFIADSNNKQAYQKIEL